MKLFIFMFLILALSSVVAQATELSLQERKDIQVFLKKYLGLSKEEEKLFKKIQILNSGSFSENLVGFAHNDGSYLIEVSDKIVSREKLLSTVVHEFIHQFYFEIKGLDEDMQLEGAALLGEFLFLRDYFGKEVALRSFLPMVNQTLKRKNLGLIDFRQSISDYGKSFLFMLFLYENFYEEDFIKTHLHTLEKGPNGVIKASMMAKSSRLTPKSWKSTAFIVTNFYWSLLKQKNVLSIRQADLFTQILSLAKPQSENTSDNRINSFGKTAIKNRELKSITFPSELTGFIVKKDLTTLCIDGNQTDLEKNETLVLLNLTDHEVLFSLPPEEVTSNN